jgi:SanA protein
MKTTAKGKSRKRWWLRGGIALAIAPALLVLYCYLAPIAASHGRRIEEPGDLPPGSVALVFGCTDRVDGRENLYFRYRIDAAVKLWESGKLRCIIVSGDNREKYYNEPETMRQALVARGVPANRIVQDFAGLRTLDSVVRAKEIFGLSRVVFVSQRFQNERAIYLARANGIEATGFHAQNVAAGSGWKTKIREIGARVKMQLDVHFLATRPRHLGERVALPE